MKIRFPYNRIPKHVSKGFALIATITLMMLLALLSVGLLTISTSQVRISEKTLFAAEAKSLARLSLEVALGQLQCELGPDQRASANSGILSSGSGSGNSPYVLGVWNSWDSWLNKNNSSGISISSTYDSGRSAMFRRWLISDPDLRKLSTIDAGKSLLGTRNNKSGTTGTVTLLGPGTLGTPIGGRITDNREIYARLVRVDDYSKTSGFKRNASMRKHIAWWVTAENQKARINLLPHASEESRDVTTILRSTWDTPGPDLEVLNLSNLLSGASGKNPSELLKLISRDTLLANNKTGRLKELGDIYHDTTLVSSSLFTDSKFGGLKKDLNILFSQDKLPEEFRNDNADAGLRPYTTDDGNPTERNRPIGSWNQLYLWSNVWDSSTRREGQDMSATLQWDGDRPTTLVASDAAANMEMMDNRYTYMRHPVLLRFYSFVGIQYVKRERGDSGSGFGAIDVRISVIPLYVWWNPYNVDLKLQGAEGNPWGSYYGEHRFMPLILSTNMIAHGTLNENRLTMYSEQPLIPYLKVNWSNRQIADFGASFRVQSRINKDGKGSGTSEEISTLKAGEIVVFAQPVVSNITHNNEITKSKENGYDNRVDNFSFKEGWSQDPGQVSSYAVNLEYGDGQPYFYLEGNPYDNSKIAKVSVRFAQSFDDLKGMWDNGGTPPAHILSTKWTEEFGETSNKLGTFMMGSGLMDTQQLGKSVALNGKNTEDPKSFIKFSPTMLNINWGVWEKPLLDMVRMPADMWEHITGPDDNLTKRGFYGKPDEHSTFVAYYGVSAKWGKSPVVGTYPEGKDYRAKTWQHSSPLFWGSQMPTASELGRSYSPYQFEVRQANSNFFPITISNILSNDGSRLSPFGGPGAEQVTKIVAAELPLQQPSSLAGFAGSRLTPGWYKTDSRAALAKRFSYQSGVPGVGIGNSFADPMLPADKVFSHNEIVGDPVLGDFWDHGFMINDALWDSWFASSLAARPRSIGSPGKEELKSVLKEAFDTDTSSGQTSGIANRRFIPDLQGKPVETVINELLKTDEGYKLAASYLSIAGGFNVNSTSEKAWEAILLGLKKRSMLYTNNGRPSVLGNGMTSFSRFGVASNNKSHVDDYGSVGVTNGIPDGDAMAWSDLRTLNDGQIRTLARNIVKQIKQRGPFLNMADFVNRRLQSGEMGVKGALQAAIDDSAINGTFDGLTDMMITPKAGYPHPEAAQGSVYTAAPGYLIQSDVLAVLGNILTTRDDTFTIRAYGELANREGVVLSRAWCEAVVQRGIHYVEPLNSPETAATKVNMKTGALEKTKLTAVNKAFGRKFNVISFRWLSPEEV